MYSHILVPLDGSRLAEAVLPHALAIARRFQSRITLFQVATAISVPTLDPLAASGSDAMIAVEAMEAAERSAREYLDQLAKRPDLEGPGLQSEVVRGRAPQEIVRRAQRGDVDLIAMSTHGRSGLGRLVFGSVADQVLRETGIPILLIKPKRV